MKRQKLAILFSAALLCAFSGTLAWAKGTPNVSNTLHNLSASYTGSTANFYTTNVGEVCVFCHTPHGGSLTGPLWNREDPAGFTHYNSVTLSPVIKALGASRTPENESLLCLSCHDGSISVNHLINVPNTQVDPIQTDSCLGNPTCGFDTEIVGLFGMVGARIGGTLTDTQGTGDLSDDHPISFSYSNVLASAPYTTGSKVGQLNSIAVATDGGDGVRFFGTDNRVECSSCHDPHVEYDYVANTTYLPFLIMSNSGSKLCLSCHNK